MTDQPTPTSSLEEARKTLSGTCIECVGEDAHNRAITAFEAAARAEVIREVEAALREICESGNPHSSPSLAGAFDAGVHAVQFSLRALSQGGEGKSDG